MRHGRCSARLSTLRVGVAEELSGAIHACSLIDDRGDGATEHVRRDADDPARSSAQRSWRRNFDERWADDVRRDALIGAARLVEKDPELVALGSHLMAVGQRTINHAATDG